MKAARIALACAAIAAVSFAHVRLLNPSNSFELHWGIPANIPIVINATGSGDVTDGSHLPALQSAIRTWNEASGSAARLVENQNPGQRARTDWQSDDIHLVYFDENDSSGYFPYGTGIVAITPVWFTNSGVISDADVLFNGQDFDFTTSGVPGCFDIQDVGTHEIGHLLGLDHSGWAGATMYPYVDPTVVLHRSLSQDDVCGLRDAYPSTQFGSISGVIRRTNDSYVAGAHVVAVGRDGRPYGSDLTTPLGAFRIHGLPADRYALYATPLDAPVSGSNLAAGHTVQTDFRTTALGSFTVPGTGDVAIGSRTVLGDASLSLGRNTDTFPVRCIAGTTHTVTLRGTGLTSGCTLAASDESIVIGTPSWSSTLVSFPVTVLAGEASGHSDLTVTNSSGERSTLVAGLEITPPDPVVDTVSPPQGSIHGGTVLTITGSSFRAGACVVIGLRTYVDGVAGGCVVESPTSIRLTTVAAPIGSYDVVVVDRTGVEGRSAGAYTFSTQPAIDSVFPLAGSAAGGTPLVLRGTDFAAGCTVTINGVVQTAVELLSDTRIAVTTGPGVPGGPYAIDVHNPDGQTASALYSYTNAPDPLISVLEPSTGTEQGGDVVLVHGANFTASSLVRFGADGDSGSGGAVAQEIELIDASTLRVVTPACSSGPRTVVVLDTATNQGAVAASAFTFMSSGGGGGGCSMGPIVASEPPSAGASGWFALVCAFAWLVLRARRSKHAPA
jgi:hypothetical protein